MIRRIIRLNDVFSSSIINDYRITCTLPGVYDTKENLSTTCFLINLF